MNFLPKSFMSPLAIPSATDDPASTKRQIPRNTKIPPREGISSITQTDSKMLASLLLWLKIGNVITFF